MPSPDEWRRRLAALRATVESDLAAGADASKPVELDQARVGRISRMDAMRAHAMSIAVKRRREVQIVRIDAALRRLDEGEFGYCMECGDEIQTPRLTLDPTFVLCVGCTQDIEDNR